MLVLRLCAVAIFVPAVLILDAPVQMILRWIGAARPARTLQMAICRLMCILLRLDVRTHGRLAAARPAIVVANHVSWTDILVLGCDAPLCFLAKAEVGTWPLIGWIVRAHGTLFVDRSRPRRLPAVNRAIAGSMGRGNAVVLFAEATTSNGSRLMKFYTGHLGAARDFLATRPDLTEVSVVPAAIAYTRAAGLPAGRADRAGIAWFGDMLLFPHVLHLLRHGPVRCEVVWGDPVPFRRGDDRKSVMAAARRSIRGAFANLVAGRPAPATQSAPVNQARHAI